MPEFLISIKLAPATEILVKVESVIAEYIVWPSLFTSEILTRRKFKIFVFESERLEADIS